MTKTDSGILNEAMFGSMLNYCGLDWRHCGNPIIPQSHWIAQRQEVRAAQVANSMRRQRWRVECLLGRLEFSISGVVGRHGLEPWTKGL